MTTDKDNDNSMMMKDLESPAELKSEDTEDPSVVVTADDSSTAGSLDEDSATKNGAVLKNQKRPLWLGVLMGVLVLMVILTAIVTCVKKSKAKVTKFEGPFFYSQENDPDSNLGEDKKKDCNKTHGYHGYHGHGNHYHGNNYHGQAGKDPLDQLMEEEEKEGDSLTTTTTTEEEPKQVELPTELPFDEVEPVRTFSADILQGYSTPESLQKDLEKAGKHILNQVILQNVARHQYYSQSAWGGGGDDSMTGGGRERPSANAAQQAGQEIASAQASATTTTATSKTNNQEEDADESDLVKNDQHYVYGVLGDYLVVWDIQTGESVAHVQMPSNYQGESRGNGGWNWAPPTRINGLLLTPDHVVVLADAHNSNDNDNNKDASLLSQYQATQVRVYSKPTPTKPELVLLATQILQGVYRDGRWLEDSQSIHLVLSGDINIYTHLVEPLAYHHFTDDDGNMMEPLQYVAAATNLATRTLLPAFVQAVQTEFALNGEMPAMLQLNAWSQDPTVNTMTVQETLQRLGHGRFYETTSDVPLRAYISVVSLHVDDLPPANSLTVIAQDSLPVTSSLVMTPTTRCDVYGTDHHLVVTLSHLQYNETTRRSNEQTFLVHLQVERITTTRLHANFHSVATVNGKLDSRYSLDIQGDDLRLATTVQKWNALERVGQYCGDRMDWQTRDSESTNTTDDECKTLDNWRQCFDLAIDGCTEMITTGCPYTYSCAHDTTSDDSSSTENYVIVFDIDRAGAMLERGRVRIGHAHEVITAVRFGPTFSYAMTFDQRDPFYVLQLEPGQAPAVLGELKLDGFSRYLHPLDESGDNNNNLLVGIGQNTTGSGLEQRNTGVMITVFDVSTPSAPVAVASHMLETDDRIESYTTAAWDAKAVQYAHGKLVIPVTMYHTGQWAVSSEDDDTLDGADNAAMDDLVESEEALEVGRAQESEHGAENKGKFEGFFVLNVGATGVTEAFRINHAVSPDSCHYCHGGLSDSRSILMDDGSLMTMYDDTVQSTNLTTGETLWTMTVELEGVPKDCCW